MGRVLGVADVADVEPHEPGHRELAAAPWPVHGTGPAVSVQYGDRGLRPTRFCMLDARCGTCLHRLA